MITHRPCGACGRLVPVGSGYKHWHPGKTDARAAKTERARDRRERDRLVLETFRR